MTNVPLYFLVIQNVAVTILYIHDMGVCGLCTTACVARRQPGRTTSPIFMWLKASKSVGMVCAAGVLMHGVILLVQTSVLYHLINLWYSGIVAERGVRPRGHVWARVTDQSV